MARRNRAKTRETAPDPVYGSVLVSKFINSLMVDGKRSLSERIFYSALKLIQDKSGKDGLEVFTQAMENVRPKLEVKSRRIGGATYQVPLEVKPARAQALSIKWLLNASRSRSGKPMFERLADELLDASTGKGGSVKKKEDTHRMAEANRAFAHFRF